MCGWEPIAEATSSSVLVEKLDIPIVTSASLHARAVASSPSGWARHCMAVGATPIGTEFLAPNRETEVSIWDISRKTRGRMRYLL